jgi:hypothetical protein
LKEKVTITIKRFKDGEVVGEVVGESSGVIETRRFGKLTEDQYERVFEVFKQESPDVEIQKVELVEN